jgi:ABC-type sugar transport system ATPase subunit
LGNEIRGVSALLDKAAMRETVARQLAALNMPIGRNQLMSGLSVEQKQMVEISINNLPTASIYKINRDGEQKQKFHRRCG